MRRPPCDPIIAVAAAAAKREGVCAGVHQSSLVFQCSNWRKHVGSCSSREPRQIPTMPVVIFTVLDESFPAWVANKVVEYITTQHRQPKYILLGRNEFITLRQSHNELAYVLSVETGERWYFQSVLILEVTQDSFLDVVG